MNYKKDKKDENNEIFLSVYVDDSPGDHVSAG
jgi:hypothetical protein